MKITYLFLGTVFIFIFIVGSLLLVDFISINSLTIKSEDKMIASAWSGFTEIDFDELAVRKNTSNLSDKETRDIYIDKVNAEQKIREFIKINFDLDDSYMPKENSFISVKNYPLIIETFNIYNPNDFNSSAITIKEKLIDRTSIYIFFKVPINVTFLGNVYKEMHIIVDSETFYSSQQR